LSELELVRRYTPKIRALVHAILGADSERDDLVHEVLIKVFTGIERVGDLGSLDRWVTQVAINTLRARIRWRKHRRHSSWERVPEPQLPCERPDPEARDVAARAVRTLARIPERDRQLLLRHWFSDTTVGELAADSGCSAVTMKRKLRKARARFERLARRDPELARRLADNLPGTVPGLAVPRPSDDVGQTDSCSDTGATSS
jgi:RNA polymerase sigma-70 factor (ECF subfamily)